MTATMTMPPAMTARYLALAALRDELAGRADAATFAYEAAQETATRLHGAMHEACAARNTATALLDALDPLVRAEDPAFFAGPDD